MPKYKVGDVAALFPKPSAPKSDTGKKIQSMFDDFYKNSNKRNKPNQMQFNQKKKQVNIEEEITESPRESKKKKRKHMNDVDSESNSQDIVQTQTKQKKFKLDPTHQNSNGKAAQAEENYFPRNKKKSKHFNNIQESSSAFSQMHFDESEDESFAQFDSEAQKPKDQKKKKKNKMSQVEPAEKDNHEVFKDKSSKKMKKFVNSRNQNEDFNLTNTSVLDESIQQSPVKKSKKKKNKKQKEGKIISNESAEEEIQSGTEDIETQVKTKQKKSKKLKQSLSSEKSLNNDSENEESLGESPAVNSTKKVLKKPLETAERVSRTLFVGNLPVKVTRQALQKLFVPFGPIETCRLRGSIPVKATIPRKVAAIKNQFHAGQKSCIGYVVFKDSKDATEALSLNGTLVGDHHIVVNPASSAGEKKNYDEKRSIFIGNLPFDVEDEVIWSAFAVCGEIEAVRAIRDHDTGAGKGFGYVLFKNIDSKEAALKMENIEISDRKIRIKEVKSNPKNAAPSNKNNKLNALKRKAKKLKGKPEGINSRKSLKKLMDRERRKNQKKKIANVFKKFSI